MLRAFRFTAVAAILLAIAWYLAGLSGQVTVEVGSYTASASTPVAILLLVVLLLVLIVLLGLLRGALGLPRRLSARRMLARRNAADAASLRALSALAAGDIAAASTHARLAQRKAPEAPMTLYVAGEAARLSGDEAAARAHFGALAKHGDAGFLGWRGLLTARPLPSDDPVALAETEAQARMAAASYPNSSWLRSQRVQIAVSNGQFAEAARLATDKRARAALEVMASRESQSQQLAIDWAREAVRDAPDLPVAWLALHDARERAGHPWRARRALQRGWKAAPHPDLAQAWLRGIASKLERARAARKLADLNPGHPESEALLAQTARDAELFAEAERHASRAGNNRAWICSSCETDHASWQITCRKCGAIGTLHWMRGSAGAEGLKTPLLSAPNQAA